MLTANTHIHTPHSFSSFASVDEAVQLARAENVRVLGISDFNTIDGFAEFAQACASQGVYPLYNIEFIAFLAEDKAAGKRWNDPANAGIMYVCGKALAHPTTLSPDARNRLRALWKGTQDLIWRVIQKLNDHLSSVHVPVALDYNEVRTRYARNTVRERHVVRALIDKLRERYPDAGGLTGALRAIYGEPSAAIELADDVGLQNQVRGKLLKAGKPAFIEEDQSAFFTLDDVRDIVVDAAGIPCYPVLADDKLGLSEYESDLALLCEELRKRQFHAVEFIPTRNTFAHLKRYARGLRDAGFCVTFGTEHNTPGKASLVPAARDGVPLDEDLRSLAYEGACVLAQHAARLAEGKPGYVDRRGRRLVAPQDIAAFARLGDEFVRRTLQIPAPAS